MAEAKKAPESEKAPEPAGGVPVPAKKSGNNKTLVIVLVVLFLVFVLPGLAIAGGLWWFGRGDNASKVAESLIEKSTGDKVDIDAKDGSYKYESEDGSYELNSGEDLPDGFPEEVPLYSDQTVTASYRSSTDDGTSWSVTAKTSDAVSEVTDFFKDKFSGWDSEGEYSANGTSTFLYKKGDLTASVTIGEDSSDTSKTSISYIVSEDSSD